MSENTDAKYLQQLARKVLAGNASDEEKLFLEEYYNAFEKHPDSQNVISAEELQQLKQSILQKIYVQTADYPLPTTRSRLAVWRWAAAAAVLLAVAGTALLSRSNDPVDMLAVEPVQLPAEILPGGNKATLTLNDGSAVVLDEMQTGSSLQQGMIQVNKTKDGELVYRVVPSKLAPATVQYNTVSTPKGGQYQVRLPDGTNVWLNAASSIHFPTSFIQAQRAVTVTGEVYFEVAHLPKQPFVVTAGSTRVEVLGTHFNVMAYNNEPSIKTTLLEGSVKIMDAGRTAVLKPGEQIQVNATRFSKAKDVDVEAELAWKNGLFYFREAGLETVMKQLERWYDISVTFQGAVPEKQFSGKVSRNVNLSELMEILGFFDDMECTIQGKTVTIKQ